MRARCLEQAPALAAKRVSSGCELVGRWTRSAATSLDLETADDQAAVFTQQLGRGLRRAEGESHLSLIPGPWRTAPGKLDTISV